MDDVISLQLFHHHSLNAVLVTVVQFLLKSAYRKASHSPCVLPFLCLNYPGIFVRIADCDIIWASLDVNV